MPTDDPLNCRILTEVYKFLNYFMFLILDCGAPPTLANGVVQLDGSNTTTYDAEATLSCNEGHETDSNQDKIKCLETGQWAEITTVCTKKGRTLINSEMMIRK